MLFITKLSVKTELEKQSLVTFIHILYYEQLFHIKKKN